MFEQHPHALYISQRIDESTDHAVAVQIFLLGVPPLQGVVTKGETPGIFRLIAMGVSFKELAPGEMPPPVITTFTADQICAVMWPDDEVMQEESRIIS